MGWCRTPPHAGDICARKVRSAISFIVGEGEDDGQHFAGSVTALDRLPVQVGRGEGELAAFRFEKDGAVGKVYAVGGAGAEHQCVRGLPRGR